MRAAQAMLAAGRGSMAEVALDAGFGSQASFSRAFRKATDLSPGQYRDLHRRALRSADEAVSVATPARRRIRPRRRGDRRRPARSLTSLADDVAAAG